MTWAATALDVIIVPGLASLLLVRRLGPTPGIIVLACMLIWLIAMFVSAQEPRNVPIQPEIFGGQTIGHSQVPAFREMFWTVFVLGPATLLAAIALLIGWASDRQAQRQQEQP